MTCMHERLERRFQQTLPIPQGPQLPLIPLGINPEPLHWRGRFANRQEQRLQARQQLGLSPCARVVLFLGRLSFHSKAHPLPLYRALERLSAEREVVLLECGHIFNADISAAYEQLKQRFPNLKLRRLGGLVAATEQEKQLALAAADLFCSPADNLQETFGLSARRMATACQQSVIERYRDPVCTAARVGWHPAETYCRNSLLDALDRSFSLGLQDYDSTVDFAVSESWLTMTPWRKGWGSAGFPAGADMGAAGRAY